MGFFYPYVLAILTATGIWFGGGWAWSGVAIAFTLHLGLDEWWKDREISSRFWRGLLLNPQLAEASVLLSFPFLVAFLGFCFWRMQGFQSRAEFVGGVLSVGLMMGLIAINGAHELVHRREGWQRALGVLNLALVNFCWYRISHVDVHHRYVGTEEDPSTARADEKVWGFWVRCFFGNLRAVWNFERTKRGLGFRNRLWHYLALGLGIMAVLFFGFEEGGLVVALWLAISVVAILMLQTVDYIEHKGLVREMGSEGRFEPVRAHHSWDCYYLISNLSLFNLGFHSNHHLKAALEFPKLGRTPGARVMRYGYPRMVLLALCGLG